MNPEIRIEISTQRLLLLSKDSVLAEYPISTARNGQGEAQDSGCTPRGMHKIRIKIGDGCAPGTVFSGRRPTGEHYSRSLAQQYPQRDWILTRILWLTGSESGFNRGAGCDTLRRYIYIHGTPDTEPMSVPLSHGCIRMQDQSLIELFDRVSVGTLINIVE